MEDFGNYLYQLRTRKGHYISQQRLGELAGFTQTYISLVETGKAKPSRGCARLVLDVLGISPFESSASYFLKKNIKYKK